MRVTTYLRVAQDRKARTSAGREPKVVATSRPSDAPLVNANGDPLPTVAFGIVLDMPDAAFRRAERVIAEVTIPAASVEIAATVKKR